MKWKIHKLRYELLHMYAAEKYVFYFYHLKHFIKFTITPCLRFQRVAKPVVSCLQMSKKFNYGIYHFGEKNFGNLATMTWHWGIQPEWWKPHCVDDNSLLDKMSNGATNSPNFKTVRHNFQKVTGQFFGNLQFRWR